MFKSIRNITLLLMVLGLLTFTWMGKVDAKDFVSVMFIVVGFFFGSKAGVPPTTTTTTDIVA